MTRFHTSALPLPRERLSRDAHGPLGAHRAVGLAANRAIPDVTGRKDAGKQAAWAVALVASSGDAIIGKDLNATIVSWNGGAQRLYGWTPDEIIGRPIGTICGPDEREEQRDMSRRLAAGESVRDWETRRRRKDGSAVDVSISVSPVRDTSGIVVGSSGIARDMTELVAGRRAMRHAVDGERAVVESLKDLDRSRSNFICSVSHELRTPLTNILGYLELVLEKSFGLTPDQHDVMEVIDRNSHRLFVLIDSLLVLSRIESGTFTVAKEPVDVRALVENAADVVRPQIDARKQTLCVEVDSRVGTVIGDPAELERVLNNIVDNAAKFTSDGGRIHMTARRIEHEVELRVSDTGIGIPEKDLENVFTAFFRSEHAARTSIAGTGLGLAISNAIVKQHGGSIECSSHVGVGTTMTVRLPAAVADVQHDGVLPARAA